MTQVINFFGGPGVGKSTTAAGFFYFMKLAGYNVELVREYVKMWAWEDRKITSMDQIYITGKQAKYEYSLYGKVDYVITDSPILLGPIYERVYEGPQMMKESVFSFLDNTKDKVVRHNIVLSRHKAYNPAGRYQTEAQAKDIDRDIQSSLIAWNIPYQICNVPEDQRIDWLFNALKIIHKAA